MDDPFDLQRFLDAQAPIYPRVRTELESGRKQSHWMWFIFPQISGLGRSEMARRYALSSLDEAVAYLNHPVLGPRLQECTGLVLAVNGRSLLQILGAPDDQKFHSCMSLFARAAPQEPLFTAALQKHFSGVSDPGTLERI